MSKYVKNLITDELKKRLDGVSDMLLVNVIGIDANSTVALRRELREKNIQLTVIKNSLARRAAEGTPYEAAFESVEGAVAMIYGGEDIISLAKEVVRLSDVKEYKQFESRGGVMDGTALTAAQVAEVSKWPNRDEQLSLLLGQILGPGATLSAQLIGPGGALASQIKQKGEEE